MQVPGNTAVVDILRNTSNATSALETMNVPLASAAQQANALCDRMERIWDNNKDRWASILQLGRCEHNTCLFGSEGNIAITYLRGEEGCAIQLNEGYTDTQTEFSAIGDTHAFSMQAPFSSIAGKTDYKNFIEADWQSMIKTDVHSEEGCQEYLSVKNQGSLKVERMEDSNGETGFKIDLVNKNGDQEAHFSAECRLEDNVGVCEINRGNGFSSWFLGNKVQVFMTKQIDIETKVETVKFTLYKQPLIWLMQPAQLGEFTVKFDPQGEVSAEGNVHLPGSKEPLFVGKLDCKDPKAGCSGNAVITTDNEAELFETPFRQFAQSHLNFEYTPTMGRFLGDLQTNFTFGDVYRNENMRGGIEGGVTENREKRWGTGELRMTTETSYGNDHFHRAANAQLEQNANGVNANGWIKDLSNPDAEKMVATADYRYNGLDPKVDTHQLHAEHKDGFEVDAKVKMPKKVQQEEAMSNETIYNVGE